MVKEMARMGEVFDNNTNQIFNSIRRAYPQLVDYSNEELLPRLADNEELLNYFISKIFQKFFVHNPQTLFYGIFYKSN